MGMRMMSQKELYDKLTAKGESPEDAQSAVEQMVKLGFIDEEEYAGAIVRRYSSQGYGPGRIRQELFRRGVPKELWQQAVEQAPQTEDTLETLIERRLSGRTCDKSQVKKTADMLRRRGFDWQEIRRALSRYISSDMEEE